MPLDVATLTFVGGLVTLAAGLFMGGYWFYDRTAKAALWWAASHCGAGIGVIMLALAPILPVIVSEAGVPVILNMSAVLTFVAARRFNHRPVGARLLVPAVMMWFVITAVVGTAIGKQEAAAVGVWVSGALNAAAAYAFWQGRAERLRARMAVILFLAVHAAALFLFSIQSALAVNYAILPSIDWLGVIHFVGLVYAIGVTMLLIMLFNQRREEKYLADASVDPLTGLFNRRGILNPAQRILDRARLDGMAVALLACDLDRFKAVNDRFGHAVGDNVLVLFADVLLASLRPADLAGRLGGEEFVAVVAAPTVDAAIGVANRICQTFRAAAQNVDGQPVAATVSIGVAITAMTREAQPSGFAALLATADRALYRAKESGRNRVLLSDDQVPVATPTTIGLAT